MMILIKVLMILMNYITKNDLAKSLGVSLSTIDRKLKELPHYKWAVPLKVGSCLKLMKL